MYKIYDKNIAPYENLDDDYESKMASIYHRGKSWTQIAEDWLFDHKGEIVTFCKSFAIAFLTTCTLMVIAAAISVSAPIVFTVFGILVAAGQCTISCIPQSAFETKWLKGIKDSSDSYVDGLNEKWKALSDRGIYGVLECIGQDIGDASQTGKGLASITGSITGSIAGGFTGDKLSLKVKKAKAAKAEAKSLKISEKKEPELKDVEGEKPKVSKVDKDAEVTSKTGKITEGGSARPTWRQSEIDARADFPDYNEQISFKDGKEVPYGTKGSVRPDYYKAQSSVDIKNYNVETATGRNNLANNISKQYYQRSVHLPQETKQSVLIDVRGQSVSNYELEILYNSIMEKTNNGITIYFKTN